MTTARERGGATSLPELAESTATGEQALHYEDIRTTLRVPVVNLIYRHMATIPGYLEEAWPQLRPNLCTVAVAQAADRLRAQAALEPPGPRLPAAALALAGVDAATLPRFRDTLHAYADVNPKGLMVVTALWRAHELGSVGGAPQPPDLLAESAAGQAHSTLPLPDLAGVPRDVLATMEHLSGLLGAGSAPPDTELAIPSLVRHFAPWPGYVAVIAAQLGPLVASPRFAARVEQLRRLAEQEVAGWPFTVSPGEAMRRAGSRPEHTWRRFTQLVAQMIVLGRVLEDSLPGGDGER